MNNKYIKKYLILITIFLLIGAIITPGLGHSIKKNNIIKPNGEENVEFASGVFIVKFKENIDIDILKISNNRASTGIETIDTLNEKYRVKAIEKIFSSSEKPYLHNIFKFIVSDNIDLLSVVEQYSKDSNVIYAEPNYIFHTCIFPNDPDFNLQYALHNTGQTGGKPDADIDAPEAWDIETGDENIVICIHDTGVDWDHPDLEDKIWINSGEDLNGNGIVDPSDFNCIDDDYNGFIDDIRGYDFVNVTNPVYPGEDGEFEDNDPIDFHGHGTHCSGIASASTNNSNGIAGVCWNCTIMPVRIGYKCNTGGGLIDIIAAAKGLEYAADNGAHIISMSWGGSKVTDLIWDAINYSYSKGCILVAAAGNYGVSGNHYPASYPNVIAVGATDHNDSRAHTAFYSNHGSWVDVAAPGEFIYSTLFNDTYETWSGTSMSTPQVAALAALILSKNPSFNQKEVLTIIRSTTDPINLSDDKYIGTGRINAYTAILRDSTTIAELSYKLDSAIVIENFSILGTATGNNFVKYEIYYGVGVYPDEWTLIRSCDQPCSNCTLAIWEPPIPEDEVIYSIRLLVYDSLDQISEDRVLLQIDRFPSVPIIEGPDRGKEGKNYTYYFNSTDFDDDEIYYYIDWGDDTCENWIGPYESGEKIKCIHNWTDRGKYTISAKAKDGYGAESDLGTHNVKIPRNKQVANSLILYLLERYPSLYLLLKYLFK